LRATLYNASYGHARNQSIVVQFTRLGNISSRRRKFDPIGEKQMTR
jgi:hypothetical protein